MQTTGRCLIALCLLPALAAACALLPDDARPKGLEERALDSEVVLAAYTRTVFKTKNNSENYSAEFLVFNILKGEGRVMELYQKRKPSSLETALNRRLVNVTRFGDPTKCQSDVNAGETYILFLELLEEGELTARYDGAYGPAVVFSRDKELALEAIGSSPWSEWSPCSGSCGGGIQQRRRQCEGDDKCSSEEGQQRTCNMFPCTAILNVLEAAGVHRSSLRPSSRPTAYKLLPSGSWRSREEEIVFPRTFPWEFSLLITVRVKPSSTGGFLLRILHSAALQVGLYISDTITLVLSDKNDIRVSFVKSLFDDQWHQLSFSVRRDTVSFFLNCEFSGRLPLPGKVRPFGGQPATLVVGSTGPRELDAFQGDIEQLTITGSPDAAVHQCNGTTKPLNVRSSTRQEVRSRTLSFTGPQNDQLPLRGDIIDDEDFSFEERGSGHRDLPSDEEYEDYDDDEKTAVQEKEKIPLKAESAEDDDGNDEEEDDDDDNDEEEDDDEDNEEEEDDDSGSFDDDISISTSAPEDKAESKETDQKNKERDYDDEHVDEEIETDEEVFEGSGVGSDFELAWSEWSPCSSTCNWGRRTRTSYCLDNGVNLDSCAEASSRRTETEACFLRLCPSSPAPTMHTENVTTATPIPKTGCADSCQNGGICLLSGACSCEKGFYGSLCQYVKHACGVHCRNGGTCYPPSTCVCAKGYVGSECQYAVCKPQCLNGGVCVAPNRCRCKPGYVGKSCHKAICQQGCKNGGECVAPNKCICRSGFAGKDCGQPVCDPPCQNGGDCVKPYFCHCPPGTKGAFCEKNLCKPDCQNGGLCMGPGKCACPMGYAGHSCERVQCPGGCENGGQCGKTGKCSCLPGYGGLHCEIRKPCKFVEVKEPYKRGYKQKVATRVEVPCGAWGWKLCTKTKVHYETVYKTFFRTSYECVGQRGNKYADYHPKLKRT